MTRYKINRQLFWSCWLIIAFVVYVVQVVFKIYHKPLPETSDIPNSAKPHLFISNGQLKQAESKGYVIEYLRRSGKDPLQAPDSIGFQDTLYMVNDSVIIIKAYTDSQ